MFDKRFFLLAPSCHGATLLARAINAHPEVTSLGAIPIRRMHSHHIWGCGERVSQCRFWQAVKTETAAQRYAGRTRSMLPTHLSERGDFLGRVADSDFLSFPAQGFPTLRRAIRVIAEGS